MTRKLAKFAFNRLVALELNALEKQGVDTGKIILTDKQHAKAERAECASVHVSPQRPNETDFGYARRIADTTKAEQH